MTDNMILTSYSGKSYIVESLDGYVASAQIMSRDELYNLFVEEKGSLTLDRNFFVWDYTVTVTYRDVAKHAFLFSLPLKWARSKTRKSRKPRKVIFRCFLSEFSSEA